MQEGPSPAQHLKPETDSSGSQAWVCLTNGHGTGFCSVPCTRADAHQDQPAHPGEEPRIGSITFLRATHQPSAPAARAPLAVRS